MENFEEMRHKYEAFEKDLKAVFEKHHVTLKNEIEQWHGGCKDIIEIHISNEHWNSWNFDDTLENIQVIDKTK